MSCPQSTILSNTCFLSSCYLLAVIVTTGAVGAARADPSNVAIRADAFTRAEIEIVDQRENRIIGRVQEIILQVYELDSIQLLESRLSQDLTADPEQSRRLVLQRIQTLDDKSRMRMWQTALGITVAMQYGIDRFPAIVFDGQAVVYGVSDLKVALAHYQAWRTKNTP